MTKEELFENYPDLPYPTGYEDCILGVVEHFKFDGPVILMDKNKMIDKMITDGMTYEEAIEYYDFNILGGYFENCPAYAILD